MKSLIIRWIIVAEVPLLLIAIFILFFLIYFGSGLPDIDELVQILRRWFQEYGLPILFVAAFLEGVFMVNFYFPGSFVILFSVIISEKFLHILVPIMGVVWLGFVLAAAFNYFLGRKGLYKVLQRIGRHELLERAEKWARKRGKLALWIAAIHPNVLALVVVNLGIGKAPFSNTIGISMVAIALWVVLWTGLVSMFLRQELVETPNQYLIILGALSFWAIALIVIEEVHRYVRK